MNRHCYRLIFSRTHGELRVVSELARSCSSEPGQSRGTGAPRLWVTVRRAVWMLGLSLSAAPALAAGIVADGKAGAGQRPQVITTQNGLPQVNITAPNKAGVSHNPYRQFDVDKRGAILNNSASMTSTKLAGMIQGNPNLKQNAAPARVILNEVNSNSPSELRGFLEVAGGRAQVIVANPAGIVCNGCGTINAGRMTLTTGKTELNPDGSLAGYRVERGTVRIEGGGLNGDARHDTEYVDVLARAVEINAGVRAKQGLNVVAGRNHISADTHTVNALAADGKAPELAIDMGQMGGMYSGQIRMIGTEAGVGVRNQGGHIQAEKTLTVSSDGKLTWQSGAQDAVTQAGGDIRLAARDDIEHQGKLHSGGTLSVESRDGGLKQSGTLAAAGDVSLKAKRSMTGSGSLLAGSDINSTLTREADLTLSAGGDISASGSLLSKKTVSISGRRVDLSQSTLAARQLNIDAQAGGVALQRASVDSGELVVNSAADVDAQQAQIGAGRWDINAGSLFARGSIWSQTGAGTSRFALSGLLDNSDGSIEARQLSLTGAALTNRRGRLVALDNAAQRWQIDGLLDNSSGTLGSNGSLTLEAGNLDNQGGSLQSQSALNIIAKAAINNAGGQLTAGGPVQVQADSLLNGQGSVESLDSLDMQLTRALDNSGGRLFSRQTQTLTAADIFNTGGWMGTQGSWSAVSGRFVNRDGNVQSGQGAMLTAATLDNRQGIMASGAELAIGVSGDIDNRAGNLSAQRQLSVQGHTAGAAGGHLNNAGGQMLAGDALTVAALSIDNGQGGLISSLQQMQLKADNALDNRRGQLESGGDMKIAADALQNEGGMIAGQQQLGLNVLTLLDNHGGTVKSNGDQLISAGQINNRQGVFSSGAGLDLTAQQLDNQNGTVVGRGAGIYRVTTLSNQQGKIHSGDALTIASDVVNNQGGQLVATRALDLHAAQLSNQTRGQISSQGALTIQTDSLNNRDGGVLLGTTHTAVTARSLDNSAGELKSAGTLTLSLLETLDNRRGRILANRALTIQGSDSRARSAVAPALNLLNQSGVVQSGDTLTVQTSTLNNQGGTLLSQQALNLSVLQDYTHRAGDTLSSNGTLTLSVAGVLTSLTDWLLPGSLTLNSRHFTNQGALVGKTLQLTTGTLINRGRLEADSLTLNVDSLDNPATLIGDDITVRARIIDNYGRDAAIAATRHLDLRASERLTNRDGSLLYSSGSLSLGSDDLIENRAASIEADGDITVEAGRLNNLRVGLNIARNAVSSDYRWHRYNYYWRSYGSKVGHSVNTMAPTTQRLTFNDSAAAANNRYGTLLAIDAGARRAQVRVKNNRGAMTVLWVNYLSLKPNADGSYAMTFYETRGQRQNNVPTPYQNTVWREHDQGELEQWDPDWHIDIAAAPYVSDYNNLRERTVTGTVTRDRLVSAGTGAHILAGGNMVLRVTGQLLNDASTLSAGGSLNIAGAKNIVNRGYSVNERRQEHIVDHYDRDTNHWYPTFDHDTTTALTTIDAILTGNGAVTIQGTGIENVTVNQAQISSVAAAQNAAEAERAEQERNPLAVDLSSGSRPLTPGELALTGQQHPDRVAMSVPDNGLFRQQIAAGSPFLVVTDARFTSRSRFISSDYLLGLVGYDPAQVVKRLGDGFYEQRLVREQMLTLTGRLPEKGEDAMAQYQRLMNNGGSVAQDFHLVPGVALTPAQIAALQQDIVWLVSETVDTAGGPQTVWVPKVYLANSTVRLSGDGALIAGGSLQLSADSLNNAANLVSDRALNVDADSFLHQGGDIRAGSISVTAGSLTLSTRLQDALRQASMSAGDITLNGKDVRLEGAKLDATQSLSLNAQNSLDIGAARSSHTASLAVISGAMGNRTSAGREEAGTRMATVSGEWQQALGSTLSAGSSLSLRAGQDITLQGSQAKAGGSIRAEAGGGVKLLAETTTNTTHLTASSRTSSVSNTRREDRLQLSTLSGDGGVTVVAGNSLLMEGAQVDSRQGNVGVSAQAVTVREARGVVSDQDNENTHEGKTRSRRERETVRDSGTGSTLSGQRGVTVIARESDIAVTGSTLHSEEGAIALQAKRDVLINSATDRESAFSEERSEKKGVLSKSSSHRVQDDRDTHEQGSLLSGESVSVSAGRDLAVRGSAIVADKDVTLAAGNNAEIAAATETASRYLLEEKKKSGLMSSGGIGFTVGSQSTRHQVDEKATTQSQSVSTVGSRQGNVSITAGNRVHIGGADLVAGRDLSIAGDSVQIDPGYDKRRREESVESRQSGLTLALSGTVGSAVNTAVSTAQQARKEGDGRLQALQGTKAILSGAQGVQAYDHDSAVTEAADAKNAAGGMSKDADGAAKGATNTVGVSLSYGSQSSKSETVTGSSQSQGSSLTAGGSLSITATGRGNGPDSGDIRIAGSQLKAGKDLSLDAGRDIHLLSAQNTESTDGKNSSRGGSVGVGIGVGSGGFGISVSASVNGGKGHETGRGLTHTETTLDAGSAVSLTSGRDTTLRGAQVSGETVAADVGRHLTLASEQDSDSYDAKQQNVSAGGSFTFGSMTGSANVNVSRDRMKSRFDSVKEQTGLYAGSGGYDIRVGEHTRLDGAVISSTAAADKNRLDTGTLGWSDIHNRADYKTEHQSAGFNSGGPVGANLLSNVSALPVSGSGSEGHAEGTTKSAVSAGRLTVRDTANQQQDVSGLSRDTAHANDGSITPIFNKEKEQKRLQQAQLVSDIASQALDIYNTHEATKATREATAALADKARQREYEGRAGAELADAKRVDPVVDDSRQAVKEKAWQLAYEDALSRNGAQTGGSVSTGVNAVVSALQGLAGGDIRRALAQGAAPYLAGVVKSLTTQNKPYGEQSTQEKASNALGHALLGGVVAELSGGSAAAGAAGGVTGELAAPAIALALYGTADSSRLTSGQKENLSVLATLAAGIASGVSGGSTADAVTGAQAGKNAVENNYLHSDQALTFDKEMQACRSAGENCQPIIDKWKKISDEQSAQVDSNLKDKPLTAKEWDKPLAEGGIQATERPEWMGDIFGLDVMRDDEAKAYVQYWNSQDLTKIDVTTPDWVKFATLVADPENQAMLLSGGLVTKELVQLARSTLTNLSQGGIPFAIKSMQVGLRNPQQVDQLKNDMVSGNYKFTAPEGRIAGYVDSKGSYYISEGNHRMVAAQEIYKKTGDVSYVEKLIQNGSWTQTKNAPAGASSMPKRK
ncbi:hemagglutinin repeat-containing protein [Erwinia sorbitola]|uniref:Filamentous hemagglutinin N-terminal domain-containing protein n=1 Tax=Erwinia sorbitola TaxID=2681984 RepID=A0A6I6EH87_9GAMM|nr:hemagglutinin repeat-containing protein [Erwinia sorbitola]QGU89257.1 filamentous hemagglutinin N-terminal domain-containing protein [Erwinia sorbitola]